MDLITTLAAFILALGILIVFHEYGHYLVARLCGVKVLRFSVGFGAPLIKKKLGRDQTEWVIAAVPFGGYVKMLDEREGDVDPAEAHRAFNRKSVWRRIAIVAAGPIANFLLAILLFWILFVSGVPALRPVVGAPPENTPAARAYIQAGDLVSKVGDKEIETWEALRWELLDHAIQRSVVKLEIESEQGELRFADLDLSDIGPEQLDAGLMEAIGMIGYDAPITPVIGEVIAGGAAERGGLKTGDVVQSVDGKPVQRWAEFVDAIRAAPARTVDIVVYRDGAQRVISVETEAVTEGNTTFGRIGAGPRIDENKMKRLLTEVRYSAADAIYNATARTVEASVFTLRMLGHMITGDVSLKNLSGPITIADYAGQSAKAGLNYYLKFLAYISISLGVLNLLPIPVLDGGHLLYYLVEIGKGSPVSERALELGQRIGLALLFTLMAFAIYNDISRLATG